MLRKSIIRAKLTEARKTNTEMGETVTEKEKYHLERE